MCLEEVLLGRLEKAITEGKWDDVSVEMLVDHYPLRRVVEQGCPEGSTLVHSMKLLAESMAGADVLLVVSPETNEQQLKPLTFNLDGKTLLVAGTQIAYAEGAFVSYLSDRVVKAPLAVTAMDAKELVLLAMRLGSVDGIVFDLSPELSGGARLGGDIRDSLMEITPLLRNAVIDVNELMADDATHAVSTLPSAVLSTLAREDDQYERSKALEGFLASCTPAQLEQLVLFLGFDEEEQNLVFTTLARGFSGRLCQSTAGGTLGDETHEHSFIPITALDWITAMSQTEGMDFMVDGNTPVDGYFSRRVLENISGRE